jgi:MYXO-CTERM domain-containing protein
LVGVEVSMVRRAEWIIAGACALGCLSAGEARAHFTLLEPESWIEEGLLGDPQKGGPCGPGPGQASTPTNAITTYEAGQKVMVKWEETIPHPGHFRIALAENRDDLVDPVIEYDDSCNPTSPIEFSDELPVLADNVHPRMQTAGTGPMFMHEITLPAGFTCEKCTLQVIQFMTQHDPSCYYYHCADIKIVAAGGASGAGGAAGMSSAGSGGGGAAGQGASGMGAGAGGSAGMRPTLQPPTGGGSGAGGMPAGAAGTTGGMPGLAGTTGGAAPTGGVGGGTGAPTSSESSSCGVSAGSGSHGGAALMALSIAFLIARRRGILAR